MRKNLLLSEEIEYEHIPVQVIGDDPANIFETLTIDKGFNNGITVGMTVISSQDDFVGLVGKVVSVTRQTAQVRPIVDQNHYVAARLQISRFIGLVKGRGREDGTLLMLYVNKTANPFISVNDLVVTSGTKSIYPPNIIIGRLKEIRSREYFSSLELVLEPVIDFTRLEHAFVLGQNDVKEDKK